MNRNSGQHAAFESHPHLRSLLADMAEPAVRGHCDPDSTPSFRIRAADSSGERSSANILIDKMYATRGYRTTALPERETPNLITLVASDHHATIGTLTIGFDSGDGLMVDDLFPDEVRALRDRGRKICEFTKLAMDSVIQSKRVLAALFNVAYIYAHRIKGADDLLIEVNPRHVRYYEAMVGFRAIGPRRLNRRVMAPAVLLALDLEYCREQIDLLGGRPEVSDKVRSIYPYSFSQREEAGIMARLRRTQVEETQVFGEEPDNAVAVPAGSHHGFGNARSLAGGVGRRASVGLRASA